MEQEVANEAHNESQTLGKYLQAARDKKKLSIEAVSRHTRINLTNLSALEADDIQRLPNIAYVRGFVKTLAKTYDLNVDEATNKLEVLYGVQAGDTQKLKAKDFPQAQVQDKQDVVAKKVQISDSLKYKAISAIAAVSVGIFIYINLDKTKEVDTQETAKEVVVEAQVISDESPMSEAQQEEQEAKTEVVEEVKQEPAPEPEQKTVVVKEKVEEPKKETEKETKEKEDEEINFYSLPSPLFAFKDISEDDKNEIIPANIRAAYEEGKQNVFLKSSSGDSWIVYKKDDDPIKKFTLTEGRYVLIKGDRVLLRLGNINAMDVFYNDELLGMTSRSGVKSLIFPVEIAKEYKLPLFIFNKDGSVQTSKEYLEEKKKSDD